MAEKIFEFIGGKFIEKLGATRDPAKLYSDAGRDKDGNVLLREWQAGEIAVRQAEEAAFADRLKQPREKSTAERIAELEARLAALEAKGAR